MVTVLPLASVWAVAATAAVSRDDDQGSRPDLLLLPRVLTGDEAAQDPGWLWPLRVLTVVLVALLLRTAVLTGRLRMRRG